jgi:hypothetical protein
MRPLRRAGELPDSLSPMAAIGEGPGPPIIERPLQSVRFDMCDFGTTLRRFAARLGN